MDMRQNVITDVVSTPSCIHNEETPASGASLTKSAWRMTGKTRPLKDSSF